MPKRPKAFQLPAISVFDIVANNELGDLQTVIRLAAGGGGSPVKATGSPKKEAHADAVVVRPDIAALKLEDFATSRDQGYFTPLHLACANGHLEMVRALLENDVLAPRLDINALSDSDITPLHCAAFNGHTDVVNLLLAKGANTMLADRNNDLPLHVARRNQHSRIVVALEPWYFSEFDPTRNPVDALNAVDLLHFQLCSALSRDETLQRGDRSHSSGAEENEIVVGALHPKHTGSITSRMSFAADEDGNTLLHLVAQQPVPQSAALMRIAQLIVQHQWYSSIDGKNQSGRTPLFLAAQTNSQPLVELLLLHGANPLVEMADGATPLSATGAAGTRAVLKLASLKAESAVLLAGKNRVPLDARPEFVSKVKQLKRDILAATRVVNTKAYLNERETPPPVEVEDEQ